MTYGISIGSDKGELHHTEIQACNTGYAKIFAAEFAITKGFITDDTGFEEQVEDVMYTKTLGDGISITMVMHNQPGYIVITPEEIIANSESN